MLLKLVLLAVVLVQYGSGIPFDGAAFKRTPSLMSNVETEKCLGRWFIQAHKPPCSWKGAEEFTNYEKDIRSDGTNIVFNLDWRKGNVCVRNVKVEVEHKGQGYFIISDPIGDVISGYKILVANDCDNYKIVWGCTRRSGNSDVCHDPWLTIETRDRYPAPSVWKKIEMKLNELWDMSLVELVRVSHIENKSCTRSTYTLGSHGRTNLHKRY